MGRLPNQYFFNQEGLILSRSIPPHLLTYPNDDTKEEKTEITGIPVYILALLQKLKDSNLNLYVHQFGDLVVSPEKTPYGTDYLEALIEKMQDQQDTLSELQNFLEEKTEEIKKHLTPQDGWTIEFKRQFQGLENDCLWGTCDSCGVHDLVTPPFCLTIHKCDDGGEGVFVFDTPRLVEAYTAVCQARFQHKKSRSEVRS